MFKKMLLLVLAVGFVGLGLSNGTAVAESTLFGNVIVQDIPGPSVAQKFISRTQSSWPWFLARSSGLVAAIALVLLMLSGIGQITGDTFRFLAPLTAWASHRALGITFGVAVLVHMGSLLFDTFVPFTILQLLVPWLSDYKPVTLAGIQLGSLYVALGVLTFYGVAVVIISSLLWVEKKPYTWKWMHLLSYILAVFIFIHALYLGTDLAHGFFRLLWIGLAIAVAVAAVYRLWRAKTI